MRVVVEVALQVVLARVEHALSQRVTENKVGATPFATNHHLPWALSHPRRRQQRRSRTSRWRQPALLWAVLSRRRRSTVRSPLPPTTVSSVLALPLATTLILTRTTLLPPARPAGHGNLLMRRLSLGLPPSYRSSYNTNTVTLPSTPLILAT